MRIPTYAIQVTFIDYDVRYICGLTEEQVKEICKIFEKADRIKRVSVLSEEEE